MESSRHAQVGIIKNPEDDVRHDEDPDKKDALDERHSVSLDYRVVLQPCRSKEECKAASQVGAVVGQCGKYGTQNWFLIDLSRGRLEGTLREHGHIKCNEGLQGHASNQHEAT